jgi:hypothetical protein
LSRDIAAGLEGAGNDQNHDHRQRRRCEREHQDGPLGWPQRVERGAVLLPRSRRMVRRRPGSVGAVGRAMPGQCQRRLPQKGPITTQVPHGPTDGRLTL